MDLFFGGAEQGTWRDLLFEGGVRHMSLSFLGLRRRVKRLDRWRLEDKFPEDAIIFLDSGAYTLNKPGAQVSAAEAEELEHAYRQFVEDNIHRLAFASEFDANVLGHDAIFANREEFWHRLPGHKWMPVWHSDYGTSNLIALSDSYQRVGVLQNDASGDLTFALNRMAGQTKLHGVAMTTQDSLSSIRWDSAGSTRWLATAQYGDTFVWTGHELKDYPRKYQDSGRTRHRVWLQEQGFNTELIENSEAEGHGRELLRLSIWSWRKYAETLGGVTTPADPPPGRNEEQPGPLVSTPPFNGGNERTAPGTALAPVERERVLLPVIGFDLEQVSEIGPDGQPVTRDEARISIPSAGMLQCSTCFIKDKCAAAEPGSACKYEIPVRLRTPAQLKALQAAIIEMQTHRVLRMSMFEQVEGAYADPNLSAELARLWKMISDQAEGKATFKLTVETSGQQASAGMISRMFGEEAGSRLALENPVPTQAVLDESGILDGEVIE